MAALGDELLAHRDEIVERWYRAWGKSPHPHQQVSEKELKDKLPVQLQVVGEQLRDFSSAEDPDVMWKRAERLDPELRVGEGIPIQDVVLGYKLVVNVLRNWIRERSIEVSFSEYTYIYDAFFELVAEAVRRYADFQAREVARERAEYLAGITHQMRSPLSAIALSIQLLDQVAPPVDAGVVERIRRNVHRLRNLVDGVMRLERFKPNELPVKPCPVYPARLIDEIVSDHELEAGRKGLRLEVRVNRTLRATMDPELFRDALGNLLDNAIKYTPSGFIRVEVGEEPETVLFTVTDSGPGISPERQRALFAPVRPDAGGGVGIGLTVAHRAVAAQGGVVGVESELGEGSAFWFRLPRHVKKNDLPNEEEPQD